MLQHHSGFTAAADGASFDDIAWRTAWHTAWHTPWHTARLKDYKYQHPRLPVLFFPNHQHPPHSPAAPSYLSLMNSGWLAYHYDLAQLGYPHEHAELQQTEPFWCQFNQVHQTFLPQHVYPTFGYTQFNYIYEPFNIDIMQDFTPVFIGSNTANGKVLRNGEGNSRPRHRGNNGPKQLERVSVMIDDTLIGDARLEISNASLRPSAPSSRSNKVVKMPLLVQQSWASPWMSANQKRVTVRSSS